jgi:hypothetical protein
MGAELNAAYEQQIDVKIPEEIDFNGFPVSVDSARIVDLQGLPPGLELICAENAASTCTYLGGTVGCGQIQGVPTEEGLFPITVILEGYSFGLAQTQIFEGYEILVQDPVGLFEQAPDRENLLKASPNPANDHTTLMLNAKGDGQGTLAIFDLLGQTIVERNISIVQGRNLYAVNTANLNEGIYIFRIDAAQEAATGRLLVVR